MREKGSCCRSMFSLPQWGWAHIPCWCLCTHSHMSTWPGTQSSTERGVSSYTNTHSTHSDMKVRDGLTCSFFQDSWDWSQGVWTPSPWMHKHTSWILTHIWNPSNIPGPFPHTDCSLRYFPVWISSYLTLDYSEVQEQFSPRGSGGYPNRK